MRLPQPFGKYLLLERISVGGMAEVFKAKAFGAADFEKIVAIKRILPSMAEDADFIQMFIDEAKICGQLNHGNICQIFELGRIDDSHFIAMEYIWGKDLLQVQNRFRRLRKSMSIQMAAFIASKVCEGLDYAHRKKDATGKPLNIIHRDVSPQNIIISYEGEVKVIDFGIAKAASRSSKTQAGVLKGKFGYMSPEQVGGKTLDQRADIFAIGTILYEILSNERLFLGESDFQTLEKVRNVAVPPPSKVRPDVPEALDKIIMKALAKETADRYQWASEMLDDLQDFLANYEPIYNAKQLAGWLRENFATEMRKESSVLDEQRKIGREAMSAAQGGARSALPSSARLRSPTLAPGGGAQVSGPSSGPKPEPAPAPVAAPAEEVNDTEGHTLIEEPADEQPAEGISNEKTSIVMPGQSPMGGDELPNESTRVLADGEGPVQVKPNGDLPGVATMVFNPAEHQAPAPAPAPPPQQQQQQQQFAPPPMVPQPMQGMVQGGYPSPYGSAVMPAMAMPTPYGTGAFSQMPPGSTGMMVLPNGAIVPAMIQAPQPVPPKSALWKDILIGVAVAVAVVGLVLGIKFALAPGKGTIVLTVVPARAATVFVDGKEYGRNEPPNSLLIRDQVRGQHQLVVRADDGEAQQTVELNSDMVQVTVQLTANSASSGGGQGSGTIRLRLPPEGALVSINGRLVSEKEIQKGFLIPAGVPNEVKVTKAGKREERFTVTLAAGQEYEKTIELKDGRGKLIINTQPPGAEVAVNGRPYGRTPVTADDLDPSKPVRVTIKKRGAGTINKLVSFENSLEQSLEIDLATGAGKEDDKSGGGPASSGGSSGGSSGSSSGSSGSSSGGGGGGGDGFLIANTIPWARVHIDGKDTGKTTPIVPRDRISLRPGKHTVTFVSSDKRYNVDVVIKSGEETKVVKDLNDGN